MHPYGMQREARFVPFLPIGASLRDAREREDGMFSIKIPQHYLSRQFELKIGVAKYTLKK
jgi:hypothetical protein